MKHLITTPTLLLDKNRCIKNLDKLVDKCKELEIEFRPHFKTHQSAEIGTWFAEKGVHKITTSSLSMASYFAGQGWNDITVAFPVNLLEIDRINALAQSIQLNVLIQSEESLAFLEQNLRATIYAFIKIDVGYGRTGWSTEHLSELSILVQQIKQCKYIKFLGFLCHAGHSYKANGIEQIGKVHQEATMHMQKVYDYFIKDYPDLQISVGDTPTCSTMLNFGCATELRPGNFIFYDLTQAQIGSCSIDEIAVAVACPVVAKHPERQEIIIYGGGVHLSKEFYVHPDYGTFYGLVVKKEFNSWTKPIKGCYLSKLSQEHGTVTVTKAFIEQCSIGDLIYILPIHSCMTANLLKAYYTTDGQYIEMMHS